MTRSLRMILLAGLALCAPVAHASYHTFQIDEIRTNAGVDQRTYGALPTDGVNALYRSGEAKANVAINLSQDSVSAALATETPTSYHGLWWNPDADGSGINLSHQGDLIFATWYTYDTSGNAFWLSMLAHRTTPNGTDYAGDIYVDSGPPLTNFTGSATPTKVGTGMLSFSDANYGSFSYNITGAGGAGNVELTDLINRFVLDDTRPQPVCAYSAAPDLAAAINYQDLWWNPSESGWGIDFAHQGNLLFATWYTYDVDSMSARNAPLWLSALMERQGTSNTFIGPLNRTSGPRFDNYFPAFDTTQVGTATVTFTDGNHADFAYVTDGTGGLPVVSQSKAITRFLFAAPAATTCH